MHKINRMRRRDRILSSAGKIREPRLWRKYFILPIMSILLNFATFEQALMSSLTPLFFTLRTRQTFGSADAARTKLLSNITV